MARSRSPVDRVFGAIVPKAVGAVDPDEVLARIDLDHLIERIDLNAVVERIDVNALVDRVDVDSVMAKVDVDAVMERVDVNDVMGRVDVNAVMARVDVNDVMGRVDVDAVMARVDVDAVMARVDVDAVMARVDVEAVMARVDLDAVMARIDLDALMARVDLDALMARVDLDTLIGKVDIDALMRRVDIDALVKRVDVNALMADVDVKALAVRAEIDQLVADTTTGLLTRTLNLARRQLLAFDTVALGLVDRMLRRPRQQQADPTQPLAAGPLARTLGFLIDSFVVSTLFGLGVGLGSSLLALFTGRDINPVDSGGGWWLVAYLAWWFLYLWLGIALGGRTVGKAVVGLQVTAVDGSPTSPRAAAVRAVVFPFSFILGLGFIPAVVEQRRRAMHDHAAGTAEIVDWGRTTPQLPARLVRSDPPG